MFIPSSLSRRLLLAAVLSASALATPALAGAPDACTALPLSNCDMPAPAPGSLLDYLRRIRNSLSF